MLKQGMQLSKIVPDGAGVAIRVGHDGCRRLTVVMEHGQLAEVPWVREERDDGTFRVYNAATLHMVELEAEGGT